MNSWKKSKKELAGHVNPKVEVDPLDMVTRALRNFERHLKLPKGKATIGLVQASYLGIEGYAKWKPPKKDPDDCWDEKGNLKEEVEEYELDEQDSEYWECKIDDKDIKKKHYDAEYWRAVVERIDIIENQAIDNNEIPITNTDVIDMPKTVLLV